jgi:hypothetical protein
MRLLWASVTALTLAMLQARAVGVRTGQIQPPMVYRDGAAVWVASTQVTALARDTGAVRAPGAPARLPTEQLRLTYSPSVQSMIDVVSATLLSRTICRLQGTGQPAYCSESGTRNSYDMARLDAASRYLYHDLAALGLAVIYDPFEWASTPMTNVVAEQPGVGPEGRHTYILCAHYDSYSNDPNGAAPGADDDASGCAAVLEAARILSQRRFTHTLRFVLFAGEEEWMRGSEHYATEAAARRDWIDGVINLDMIGYESVPPNDHVVEIHAGTRPDSARLADALIQCISMYDLRLVPEKLTADALTYCDQAPFWERGYAGILCIEDSEDFNPHYHEASDTLANLQLPLVAEFTRAAVAVLAELASASGAPAAAFNQYLPAVSRY